MKILKIENTILILMLVFFAGASILSINGDERLAEIQESCFTQAKDDASAKDICFQISSATNRAVSSARKSTYPIFVLLLGLIALLTVKTRRLDTEIKNLTGR